MRGTGSGQLKDRFRAMASIHHCWFLLRLYPWGKCEHLFWTVPVGVYAAAECLSSLAVSALQMKRRISYSQEASIEEKKEHNLSIHFASSTYFVKPIKKRSWFTHSKKQVEIKTFKWTKNRLSLAILWDLTFHFRILTLPLVWMFRQICPPIYAFAKPKNIHSINTYWSFLFPLM